MFNSKGPSKAKREENVFLGTATGPLPLVKIFCYMFENRTNYLN